MLEIWIKLFVQASSSVIILMHPGQNELQSQYYNVGSRIRPLHFQRNTRHEELLLLHIEVISIKIIVFNGCPF